MTRPKTLDQRIRTLNDNERFQLLGRVSAVVAALVVAPLTVWAVTILLGISNDVAVLKSKVEAVVADQYKGGDARRDFSLRDNMIGNNTARLDEHGRRITALEDLASRR